MSPAEAADRLASLAGDSGRPSFRLWHFPPDGPWTTWMLFSDALLREAVWDRQEGFSTREARFSEEEARAFISRAFLDLSPEDVADSLSTSEFGIEGFANRGGVVRWNRPVPPTLRSIAAWHSRTRARFEEKLDT